MYKYIYIYRETKKEGEIGPCRRQRHPPPFAPGLASAGRLPHQMSMVKVIDWWSLSLYIYASFIHIYKYILYIYIHDSISDGSIWELITRRHFIVEVLCQEAKLQNGSRTASKSTLEKGKVGWVGCIYELANVHTCMFGYIQIYTHNIIYIYVYIFSYIYIYILFPKTSWCIKE